MRWPKACLGDVTQVVSGATPKSSVDEYWDGDIPWITPADLSSLEVKEVSATSRRITEAGLSSCSSRILPPRSVLFSSRAPIGHVAINTIPMATNQGFKSFVPDQEILSSDFLYWWPKTNKAYLQSLGRGATFKEVSKEIVESIEIPLPPLEEQRRIAAILDRAQDLEKLAESQIKKSEALASSFFKKSIDDAWKQGSLKEESLGDISIIAGQYGATCSSAPYDTSLPRYVRITDIQDDGLLSPVAVSPSGPATGWADLRLVPGDLLFARSGATVGKT